MLKILLSFNVECPICKTEFKKGSMQPMVRYDEMVEHIYIKCEHQVTDEEKCKGYIELLEKDHTVFL